MGSTFLSLTNKLLRSLNEVELTSSNFASAIGFHSHAKDAINYAIQDIYQSEVEWPFAYTSEEITCVAGTYTYALDAGIIRPDWESFRLKDDVPDTTINSRYLPYVTYEKYLVFGYKDRLDNADSSSRGSPEWVANLPDNRVAIGPFPPDLAYVIEYDGYSIATDLVDHDDTTDIPSVWDRVILEGGKKYAYQFRDNIEQTGLADRKFQEGIKNMRTVLLNKYQSVYDTRSNMRLRSTW